MDFPFRRLMKAGISIIAVLSASGFRRSLGTGSPFHSLALYPMRLPSATLRKAVTVCRPLRPYIERPQWAEYLCYFAAIAGVAMATQVLVVKNWNSLSEALMLVTAVASCIAFLGETFSKIKAAVSSIWAKVAGKALFGILALLANYLATSLAKNYCHVVVHVDPKHFSEFIGIVSVGITAFIFLFLIQSVVIVLGFVRLISSYLVLGLHRLIVPIAPNAFNISWRIMLGKRSRFLAFKHTLFATIVFFGSATLGVALAYPVKSLARNQDPASVALTQLLVFLEYRTGSSCTNMPKSSRIAYLERGWVSVADSTPTGYRFSQAQCNYAANTALQETLH